MPADIDIQRDLLVWVAIGLPLLYVLLGALVLRVAVNRVNTRAKRDAGPFVPPALIPDPSVGRAALMMLASLPAHLLVSSLCIAGAMPLAWLSRYSEPLALWIVVFANVIALILHFGVRIWIWSKLLPASLERSTSVVFL